MLCISESVDLFNDLVGHWQFVPPVVMDAFAGVETAKMESTLVAIGRAQRDGADGSGCHCIVVFLVCLCAGATFDPAVSVAVWVHSCNQCPRAEGC